MTYTPKISIDAGFTCPNRDGRVGTGGCSFCLNDAFNPSYCLPQKSVSQQIAEGIEFHQRRYRRAGHYLAYFQPHTNTYAPLSELRRLYEEALSCEGVVGLVIGTRPDSVAPEVLDYLESLSRRYYVMVEYGVESVDDVTLRRVNRGHTFGCAEQAIRLTAERGINTGAHLILGLPGETPSMMLRAAEVISQLPLTTLKLHQLQIFKNTPMARDFINNPSDYHLFSLEEYIDFVIDFVERLSPDIVVERFAGEVPPRYLLSEPWLTLRYDQVLNRIERRMEERNAYQGRLFSR